MLHSSFLKNNNKKASTKKKQFEKVTEKEMRLKLNVKKNMYKISRKKLKGFSYNLIEFSLIFH